MKAFLMYKNRDFDLEQPAPVNEEDLVNDLELTTLFNAMALGDKFLFKVVRKAILCGLTSPEEIKYRQAVLKDCLKNAAVVRAIYQIPLASIENKHRRWMGIFTHSPSGVLSSAVELMMMFVELLKQLKQIAVEHADQFESEGFTRFFSMIVEELDDEYFSVVDYHLKRLKFREGVFISADLGRGNEGTNYTLRLPNKRTGNWLKEVITKRVPVYSFMVSDRDEAGARALGELKDRGINVAANALAQSADHIDSFLNMLRIELAFFIGCINLSEQLDQQENPITYPIPDSSDKRHHSFQGLYDVCLALTMKKKIVGNELVADQKNLVIITGANQGGKSTFLRSIGLAQLMMQSGMYVPALEFRANICDGIFTHYKRKEDASMKSGKLDEELGRMSKIVDVISPNAMLLFNESFAATNEREGSEIARQITNALVDRDVKVFFVTHMYEFAHAFFEKKRQDILFLRAERKAGGKRTFKLVEGEPLQTSFGQDVFKIVFGGKGDD